MKLNDCFERTKELSIPIYGDIKFRGNSNKEDDDLVSFFSWIRFNYPQYKNLVFHPEMEMMVNGGRSYAYYARSKSKGRLDGMGDIVCLPINKNAPAFICELKRKNAGKSLASKALKLHYLHQVDLLADQLKHGNQVCVAFGFDAAKNAFEEYVKENA